MVLDLNSVVKFVFIFITVRCCVLFVTDFLKATYASFGFRGLNRTELGNILLPTAHPALTMAHHRISPYWKGCTKQYVVTKNADVNP
jgi:hypothetical protein